MFHFIHTHTHTHTHTLYILFIHLPAAEHLGCLHYLYYFVNSAAMNMSVQTFLRDPFGYIPRSGTAESSGRSIFNLGGTRHTVFLGSSGTLHFHQQCPRVPLSPHPCPHLSSSGFSIVLPEWLSGGISLWFWFSFSPMPRDAKHLFVCLLVVVL